MQCDVGGFDWGGVGQAVVYWRTSIKGCLEMHLLCWYRVHYGSLELYHTVAYKSFFVEKVSYLVLFKALYCYFSHIWYVQVIVKSISFSVHLHGTNKLNIYGNASDVASFLLLVHVHCLCLLSLVSLHIKQFYSYCFCIWIQFTLIDESI